MVRWPSAKDLLGYFAVVVSVIVFSAVACSVDDFVIAFILGVLDKELGTGNAPVTSGDGHEHEAIRTLFTYLTTRF